MARKTFTDESLATLVNETKSYVDSKASAKVDKVNGKDLSTNDYTTAEKTKLSGIATGAEVNQNAFSNIKVGTTTVAADAKTDTIEFVGSNVTITPDATNDKVTFAVADGTTSAKGVVQLTNSTSSTSTTTAATPNSVKSAYDLANSANTKATNAQTAADSAADNSITGLSVSGQTVIYTKGNGTTASITTQDTKYTHPSYTAITGVPTADTTPGFGETFTVSQPVSDATGHITALTDRTITIPATAASDELGLVKSGGDVTIADGVITVNDDSHNHTIDNIDNLQSALDGKLSTTGTAAAATTASKAGTATYATNAGTSVYGTNAGTATYATNAGTATYSSNGAKATSATSATYATTATKAGTATYATNSSTATYATKATTATYVASSLNVYGRQYIARDTSNVQVGSFGYSTAGTTANTGTCYLIAGNSKASSVANNSRGYMRLYDATSYYTQFYTATLGANRNIVIPNASGTMALMSHLNRTNGVNSANTGYTTYMARAIAASTASMTAGTSTLTNGCIFLQYE